MRVKLLSNVKRINFGILLDRLYRKLTPSSVSLTEVSLCTRRTSVCCNLNLNFCEVIQNIIDLVSIEVEEINTWIMITRQPESLPLMFEFNE